jgi:hypothetical protein
MSLTIQLIDEAESQKLAPAKINSNFNAIKAIIDKIEASWNLQNNKLMLVASIDAGVNGVSANAIGLSATAGNAIFVSPNGGAIVYSTDYRGWVSAKKITITGGETSSFPKLSVTEQSAFGGVSSFGGVVDYATMFAKIKYGISQVSIIPANIGDVAPTPLDISALGSIQMYDCSNAGATLTGTGVAKIKVALSTIALGQRFRINVQKINSNDKMAFYNGTAGSEYFAKQTLGGNVSLASTISPTHDGTTIGAYLDVVYVAIATNINRLLILDSKGFAL